MKFLSYNKSATRGAQLVPIGVPTICLYILSQILSIYLQVLEHDRGQTDSRARSQRLSAAHHNVEWSILIGFKFSAATPTRL